jgi:hypothetical protein
MKNTTDQNTSLILVPTGHGLQPFRMTIASELHQFRMTIEFVFHQFRITNHTVQD